MSKKETIEKLVACLEEWQKIERKGIASTALIQEQTDNPVIDLVMDIIQRDSATHKRVQKLLIETLTGTVSFSPEELAAVWGGIEEHIALEKATIDLANEALAALEKGGGRGYVLQQYLLSYLKTDEEKHDRMLADLGKIQKGMYPYG